MCSWFWGSLTVRPQVFFPLHEMASNIGNLPYPVFLSPSVAELTTDTSDTIEAAP